jgi:hypothetical protein
VNRGKLLVALYVVNQDGCSAYQEWGYGMAVGYKVDKP